MNYHPVASHKVMAVAPLLLLGLPLPVNAAGQTQAIPLANPQAVRRPDYNSPEHSSSDHSSSDHSSSDHSSFDHSNDHRNTTTVQVNAFKPLGNGLLKNGPLENAPSTLVSQLIEPDISSALQTSQTLVNTQGNYTQIEGGRQISNNLFHQFESFNVDTNNTANFITPASVQSVIGQVNGGHASYINGTLKVSGSNADLYLINPAGIIFGADAQLNLGGSFTATTADQVEFEDRWLNTLIANDYSEVKGAPTAYQFSAETPGAIINQGNLAVGPHNALQLIGGSVINTGTLSAPAGEVTLSAQPGNSLVRLNAAGSLLSVEVEPNDLPSQLVPLLLPELLTGSPTNMVSDLQQNSDGSVTLVGSTAAADHTLSTQTGTLTNAGVINVSGELSRQTGGTLNLLGNHINVIESALSASGNSGGGLIRIGGDFQGKGPVPNAETVFISAGTLAQADAIASGNGGQIIVWADGDTNVSGTLSARGAAQGAGGLVETSGLQQLTLGEQLSVSTDAPSGQFGTWLLDPIDLTVVANGGTATIPGNVNEPTTATTIDSATLVTALDRNNVTLQATNAITVEAPVDVTSNSSINDLRLEAPTVNLNAPISFRPGAVLSGTASTVNLGERGTLLNGVSAIANNGTVNLAGATYDAPNVEISRNVTLQGQGRNQTIIRGDNTSRLFSISGGTTTLAGLTLENGNDTTGTTFGGGAIRVTNNASLTLLNSLVQNNSSNASGGGILLDGSGTSLIQDTTIQNNSAGVFGGGVMSLNGHSLTVDNSLVTGNTAGINGGGLDGNSNSNALTILNSDIINNQAQENGGGLSVGNAVGTFRIENSTIANNQAITQSGGGLHSQGTPINILNTTFRGNEALANSNGQGGAITTRGPVTIDTSRFENNRAYTGGALFLAGSSGINSSIVDATFDINRANADGGAIALQEQHQLDIERTTLSNNVALGDGGAIAHTSNSLLGLSLSLSTVTGNQAESGGGLHITAGAGAEVSQATLANNVAANTGGGINNIGNVSLQNTLIADNSASFAPDFAGTFNSLGTNLLQRRQGSAGFSPSDLPDNTDPRLGPLADNGGPTFTLSLRAGSPAIDGGQDNGDINASDQRGILVNGLPDIGAFESTLNLPVEQPVEQPENPATGESTGGSTDPPSNPPIVEPTPPPTEESGSLDSLNPFTIDPTQRPSSNDSPLSEMLDNEDQQQNEGRISFFDGVAFSQVERSLTEEYANYWQQPLEGDTSFEKIQQLLQTAEEQHQAKTAVVYALFVPRSEENSSVDNRYPSVLSQRLLRNDVTNEQDQLLLMVIGPNGEPVQQLVDVSRKDITLQATLLGLEISSFIDEGYQPLARQLYSWLLAPIEEDLANAGIDNLTYVLDEGLRTVPLAAMMDGDRHAIEKYGISMLPSVGLLQNEFGTPPAEKTVLAAGADTFSTQLPLPAVPTELDLVRSASTAAQVLLNEDFTIENVTTAQATNPRGSIHLATHAVFNAGSVDRSFIQFWDEKLTLDNLDSLGLQDLELLILSACTTAIGNRHAELGFSGLAASLGVESSVGSLWNVSDVGTMALMAEFYEQLRGQPLRFSALQQAQLSLLQGDTRINNNQLIIQNNRKTIPDGLTETEQVDFSHPFFWAGFTLIGNPWW